MKTDVIEETVSEQIAEWAANLTWEDLTEEAVEAARRTFANCVGLAIGAADHDVSATIRDTGLALGAGDSARILASTISLSPQWASLAMGAAMHVEDFDDTYLRTILHPGAPTVAAALGAAQLVPASGRDIIIAVAAGVEISSRLGNAVGVGHFNRGWHVTGTTGHIGAAITAGRLLGLTREQMHHAIALASTQAQGHTQQLGSMTKALHPGKAAFDGVEAALLAQGGFSGPRDPFFGRRGFAALMSPDQPDPVELLDELGTRWELKENSLKPYACGIVSHPVIDAGIAARDAGVAAEDIASIEARVHPVVLDVMGVENPGDGLQSKFSVYHCFAVGLLDGAAGPAQYSDARATAADVADVRRKITVITDEAAIPRGACIVTIQLRDGTTRTYDIPHASGSIERPMTNEQLHAKFQLLVTPILGEGASRAWELAFHIDRASTLQELFDAAA